MFELQAEPVKLAHINIRTEKHGEEDVQAVDVKFERVGANTMLDDIAPGLRTALYREGEAGDQADAFNGTDGLVALRFPSIEMPLKLDGDYPGYSLEIDTGMGLQETLKLKGVFKKNRVTALAGGSCTHEFTVSTHPTAEQVGRLYEAAGNECTLTLSAPAPFWPRAESGDSEDGPAGFPWDGAEDTGHVAGDEEE